MRPLDDFYEALGANIRAKREELNLTQLELGEQIGLSRTSITNIERGRQRLMADQLLSVADALNTNVDALLPIPDPKGSKDAAVSMHEMPTVSRFIEKTLSSFVG